MDTVGNSEKFNWQRNRG